MTTPTVVCLTLIAAAAAAPAGQEKPEDYGLVGPYLRFTAPDSAEVRWRTDKPMASVLEYEVAGVPRRREDAERTTTHRVVLEGLRRNAMHEYRLVFSDGGQELRSQPYECDTTFNYCLQPVPADGPAPYPEDALAPLYRAAADYAAAQTPARRGYCLVLGCNQGRLAYELAKRTEFHIIGVDTDRDAVAAARDALRSARAYGYRINLYHVESLEDLPLPSCFANLIVSDRMLVEDGFAGAPAEVARVLRPLGGRVVLGRPGGAPKPLADDALAPWLAGPQPQWAESRDGGGHWITGERPPVEGAGEWTHQYGRADNSARSGETLGGATHIDDLDVQWLGRPGARAMMARNARLPAPLYADGRLFIQGLNRIIAVDAYNGAILWSIEVPDLNRVNMPRDCGNCCTDGEFLYAAVGEDCWRIEAATGLLDHVFSVDERPLRTRKVDYQWGYVARVAGLLFGSTVRQNTVFKDFWGKANWYDGREGTGTYKVCSDQLFAMDPARGDVVWKYKKGAIINPTIAIAEASGSLPARVYFVECRNEAVLESSKRRLGRDELWQDQHLVALDAATGDRLWEQPIDTVDGTVVFYLIHANDTVLIASSQEKYHLYAYDEATGALRWENGHDWVKDNHGGHMQHPAVVGNSVFLEPCGYNLATGERLTEGMGRHGGCATYAATEHALIYRGGGGKISLWDVASEEVTGWQRLRPGCWLTTVAGGGMVLSPEAGGGCSCGVWMETSLAFAPWFH
ncbi:MAG: PQQ-binding-like beta-propeller repeat protein [Candidatus Hydrogenedentes bacterium]|nr:PQQ-binding-like beta-propeller repeat protein [Candidatus Hydrogenedentota bacterium]